MRSRSGTSGNLRLALPLLLITLSPGISWTQECSLSPGNATRDVGQSHTITVGVYDGDYGFPYPGARVDFRVTGGPNSGVRGSGVTNKRGEATWKYTGSGGAGTDSIEARGSLYTGAFSCNARVTWKQGQNTLLDLDMSASGYVVIEAATATARLTRNGAGMQGVPVQFEVVSGPHKGLKGTATTDETGRARFAIQGNGLLGTDTVEATANVSAREDSDLRSPSPHDATSVSSQGSHEWCETKLYYVGTSQCASVGGFVGNCIAVAILNLARPAPSLDSGRLDLYRAFRDQVLNDSQMGRQYVSLYYELSGEAVDIVSRNPQVIPRVLEILDQDDALIRQLVATGAGVLSDEDRRRIDELLAELAVAGSERFWHAMYQLRTDLYDDAFLKEFGVTVK